MVRGLDYYTSTVFEFTTTDLGAQSTVLAGGRYDSLVEEIGGVGVPAVGFGGGLERLMLLINEDLLKKEEFKTVFNTKKYTCQQNTSTKCWEVVEDKSSSECDSSKQEYTIDKYGKRIN